ncbi:MAG: TetR/AcrR family transcriptional regulator [Myxococcota bacterium]|nr:TetR/AcrR family transcriptional regulator [Myxococcota bacterium]
MSRDRPITEKQRRVLDSALEVFAEQGFSATSTGEIARRAGVAAGTVFRFYRTKKDLLVGVVTPLFKRFVAPQVVREFGKILDADYEDLDAFLRAVFTDRLDWVRKHRLILRVALQETPLHPELKTLWNESVIAELRPRLLGVIERFQSHGMIVDLPPETVARTAASVLLGYAIQRFFVEPDRDWDDELELESMIAILKRGLSPT